MTRLSTWAARGGVSAVMVLGLASCGSGPSGLVNVRITDRVQLSRASHKADTFPMQIDNLGRLKHKLVVVGADHPVTDIPLLPDGQVDRSALEVFDELPTIGPGRYRSNLVNIQPGRYLLICTLASPGVGSHLRHGLYAEFTIIRNPELEQQ